MMKKSLLIGLVLFAMFFSLQCGPGPENNTAEKLEPINLDEIEIIFEEPDKPEQTLVSAQQDDPQNLTKTESQETQKNKAETEPQIQPVATEQQAVIDGYLLAFRYPLGNYSLEQTQSLNLDLSVHFQQQVRTQQIGFNFAHWMDLNIDKESDESNGVMNAAFSRVKIHIKLPNQEEKDIDTDQPDTLGDMSEADMLAALMDRSAELQLDHTGRLVDVSSLGDIWDSILQDYPDKADDISQFKMVLGGGTLMQLAAEDKHFPERPVDVGDQWEIDSMLQVSLLGESNFNTTYTLSSVEETEYGQVAVIDFTGTLTKHTADLVQAGMSMPGMDEELNMPFTGQMRIWLETGMLLEQTIDYEYEFKQSSPNPQMPMEVSIKLTGRQSIILTPVE